MSLTVLQVLILLLLAITVTEARGLSHKHRTRLQRNTPIQCSHEHLNLILDDCRDSVIPRSTTSIANQFCGRCKQRIEDYAEACDHTSFSLNITGTCLVNNNHRQCVFAVILIRPGISTCKASPVTTNNQPSTIGIDTSIQPICSLYTSYNTTGEYYQIAFDPTLMRPVIQPPLLPPWDNCSAYYGDFGTQILVNSPIVSEVVECSQSQLQVIMQDCEQALRPTEDGDIRDRFCGITCRSQIVAYAATCNISYFSLNITGICETNPLDTHCIFAVILIRPGVSACFATSIDSSDSDSVLQTNNTACCLLHSSVNTTGEYFAIVPNPQMGTPIIQPPLEPPWESCSVYMANNVSCSERTGTLSTTQLPIASTTHQTTKFQFTAATTFQFPTAQSVSMHQSNHLFPFLIMSIIIIIFSS